MSKNIDENIPTKAPNSICPSISIIGMPMEYSIEHAMDMLIKQNDFVKQFSMANNMDEHFKVLAIRPTKKGPSKFQVFATLSAILRDILKQFRDKLTLGLSPCKVFDQYHVKRCNKCQLFGHYYKDCTSAECCAKCGGNHLTKGCGSTEKKCINCVRGGIGTQDHYTFDTNCPSLLKQQVLIKQRIEKTNLNVKLYKEALKT